MRVPGVGYASALSFKAAVDDDPGRFKSVRTVGARFGLPPRRFQSGEKDNPGRPRMLRRSALPLTREFCDRDFLKIQRRRFLARQLGNFAARHVLLGWIAVVGLSNLS
ncbi:transposase [Rhizobium gallicum]|uniref:transposase n=1 Tax=Rhizobium gallicum TaxID=56730 RepID=UPI00093FE7EA